MREELAVDVLECVLLHFNSHNFNIPVIGTVYYISGQRALDYSQLDEAFVVVCRRRKC